MSRVIDTSSILEFSEQGILTERFNELFQTEDEIYIPFEVLKEIQGKLDEDKRTEFERIFQLGIKKNIIVKARHKYKLSKFFKKLTSFLKTTHIHLSRTDRIVIALAGQTHSYVETTDTGIIKALSFLKISKNPWKINFLNLNKKTKTQLTP